MGMHGQGGDGRGQDTPTPFLPPGMAGAGHDQAVGLRRQLRDHGCAVGEHTGPQGCRRPSARRALPRLPADGEVLSGIPRLEGAQIRRGAGCPALPRRHHHHRRCRAGGDSDVVLVREAAARTLLPPLSQAGTRQPGRQGRELAGADERPDTRTYRRRYHQGAGRLRQGLLEGTDGTRRQSPRGGGIQKEIP